MTRSARLALRTGPSAVACRARTGATVPTSTHARAVRPVDHHRPSTSVSSPRQAGLDRSTQPAGLHPLPVRAPQDASPAAVAITGAGHRWLACERGALSPCLAGIQHLDRSWDRATLTGARA